MAVRTSTFSWQDALNAIHRTIPSSTESDYAQAICNYAQNTIWMRWDWRETLAELPPFWLTPNLQDHGAPAVVIPTDFLGLRIAYLIRMDTNPPMYQEMDVIKDLRKTHIRYFPHAVGYNPEKRSFRVFPLVQDNIGGPLYMIGGSYKVRPPKLTAANIPTTFLPFDDMYFQMFVETVRWAGFALAGDSRAGQVSVQSGGGKMYTGQLATAMSLIDQAAANEGLEMGDPVIAPQEPLVAQTSWRPNIIGVGPTM